jgi:hypothetical protein
MSDERRYQINKKCLAATRAWGTASDHDTKWDYAQVSSDGIIVTNCVKFIKIDLPPQANAPTSPRIFPKNVIEKLRKEADEDEIITLPEGVEAKSNGTYSVPNFQHAIPSPEKEVAHITVTAKDLIELLKSACDVTDHTRYLVRLRIMQVGKNPQLRIDAHKDDDGQAFVANLMGTHYTGINIPGDKSTDVYPVEQQSEVIDETKLELPLTEGRKFRT